MTTIYALLGRHDLAPTAKRWDTACYALRAEDLPFGGWSSAGMVERVMRFDDVPNGDPAAEAARERTRCELLHAEGVDPGSTAESLGMTREAFQR